MKGAEPNSSNNRIGAFEVQVAYRISGERAGTARLLSSKVRYSS